MSRISLLNLPIDSLLFEDTVKSCIELIHTPGLKWAVTLNPEIAVTAQKDQELKQMIQQANLVTADGSGLLWGASYLNELKNHPIHSRFLRWLKAFTNAFRFFFSRNYRYQVLPGRVTGIDLVRVLLRLAGKRGYRVFLLGGKPGVAEELRQKLFAHDPRLQVVGATDGFQLEIKDGRLQPKAGEEMRERQILNQIRNTKPHLLLVAFGPPKQERWIFQHQKELREVKLAIGVGGTFDFLIGKSKRAPRWMQKIGLEGPFRLICEPKRLKRLLASIPKFVSLIVNS